MGTFAFLVIVLAGVVGLWQKERALNSELAILDLKMAEIKTAREKSFRKLHALNTAEGIEVEARGKFNLKKEGEEMVVFLDGRAGIEIEIGFWNKAVASPARIWQSLKNWLRF